MPKSFTLQRETKNNANPNFYKSVQVTKAVHSTPLLIIFPFLAVFCFLEHYPTSQVPSSAEAASLMHMIPFQGSRVKQYYAHHVCSIIMQHLGWLKWVRFPAGNCNAWKQSCGSSLISLWAKWEMVWHTAKNSSQFGLLAVGHDDRT